MMELQVRPAESAASTNAPAVYEDPSPPHTTADAPVELQEADADEQDRGFATPPGAAEPDPFSDESDSSTVTVSRRGDGGAGVALCAPDGAPLAMPASSSEVSSWASQLLNNFSSMGGRPGRLFSQCESVVRGRIYALEDPALVS